MPLNLPNLSTKPNKIPKIVLLFPQALAMWSVMKFYHLIRVGVSFKYSNQNIIELWQNGYESDSSSDSQIYPTCKDIEIKHRKFSTPKKTRKQNYTYIFDNFDIEEKDDGNISNTELLNDSEEEEDDSSSLLAVYDSNSVTSLWPRTGTNAKAYDCSLIEI